MMFISRRQMLRILAWGILCSGCTSLIASGTGSASSSPTALVSETKPSSGGMVTSPTGQPARMAGSRTVTYVYDIEGRLVRVDYDSGKSVIYVYDQAGNLLLRRMGSASDPKIFLPLVMR